MVFKHQCRGSGFVLVRTAVIGPTEMLRSIANVGFGEAAAPSELAKVG